jgi:hypothetical protein
MKVDDHSQLYVLHKRAPIAHFTGTIRIESTQGTVKVLCAKRRRYTEHHLDSLEKKKTGKMDAMTWLRIRASPTEHLSSTVQAAIYTGMGVLILGLIVGLCILLVRAKRNHERLMADLEEIPSPIHVQCSGAIRSSHLMRNQDGAHSHP